MSEKNNQQSVLSQAGIIILVITLILSAGLIVFGGVKMGVEKKQEDLIIELNVEKEITFSEKGYYEIEFTPNTSGKYTISLKGAYVQTSTIKNLEVSSIVGYSYSYKGYLNANNKYVIKIYAYEKDVKVYITR